MSLVEHEIEPSVAHEASLELSVLIHTHNSARYIKQTLASLLKQNNVRFDVIVIDHGSTDETVTEVEALDDPQVRLIKKKTTAPVALKLTSAPFIAEVGDRDLVLPGCLRKLVDKCRSEPDIGLVHCYSFEVNHNGETSRDKFHQTRTQKLNSVDKEIDSIRLYRRTALEANSKDFKTALVPEFLYARRIEDRPVVQIEPPLVLVRRYLEELYGILRRLGRPVRWRIWRQLRDALYLAAVKHLSSWPIGPTVARTKSKGAKRNIAYYIWHFPVLSQTFVNRELAALKQSGLSIQIIADGAESLELADENAKLLLASVHYLEPPARNLLRTYGKSFFKQHPLRFLNLLFFVITHRHDAHKGLDDNLYLFSRATHLAQLLKKLEIDHIHTPWADQTSYIALLAAKLCGITFSVQARAHDIHRKSYLYGLREKFENAEFIVTNTHYNQDYIRSLISERHHDKVKLIYNGIDLDKFVPPVSDAKFSSQINILCVARLIEQKGFPYLLGALSQLRERGHDFRCDIVGGPELPLYADYLIQLKKLHRKLGLEDHVFFHEAQPFGAVMEKYAVADIVVLPCVIAENGSRDITPNSLIEAMAMKLPVISTTVTGIPEIVEDGVSGLLVPPHDAAALTTALETLIQQPDLRRKLGEGGRKRVEERFNIKENNLRRMELFRGLL